MLDATKSIVLDFYDSLASTDPSSRDGLGQHLSPDYVWRGSYPFGAEHSADTFVQEFWQPLTTSLTNIQRRQDVFFAGLNDADQFQSCWVVSMGHLMGLFDQPFPQIPPTRKMIFLRYAEFHQVVDGKIAQTAMFLMPSSSAILATSSTV